LAEYRKNDEMARKNIENAVTLRRDLGDGKDFSDIVKLIAHTKHLIPKDSGNHDACKELSDF